MNFKNNYNIFFKSVGFLLFTSSSLFANVTGSTFRDFNGDGIQQAGETGRAGIIVKAYSDTATGDVEVASTTTVSDGSYTLNVDNSKYPIRLEYTIPTGFCNLDVTQDYPAANGNTYGTDIQFAQASGEVHDFIFNYPADFSVDANPRVFLPKFGNGDPLVAGSAADSIAMTSFHYLDSGHAENSGRGANDGPAYDEVAKASQLGSVYGVAYSRQAEKVFASAFLKRHAGMGPLGGGGIYMLNPNPPYDTNKNLAFMDFDDLGIATSDEVNAYTNAKAGGNVVTYSPVIGTNAERGLLADNTQPNTDSAAYSQVGKLSFGDIDVSEDGQFLYVVNLYDRKLYEVDLTDAKNPVAPTLANVGDKIHGYSIPDVCSTNNAGEYRPFALKITRGNAYVGITCSGETATGSAAGGTAADMKGVIYKLDLNTHEWATQEELSFTFDYRDGDKPWHTWDSTWKSNWEYGEPLISDLEFDGAGNMLIGIMDRMGHKKGYKNHDLDGAGSNSLATVGELLRAVRNTATQECTYNITTNPEFYDDNLKHTESSQGALAIHRTSTFDGVLATFMDPIDTWSAGVVLYDNSDGDREQTGYEIFYKNDTPATFGKAGGLGDLEVMEKVPAIEIGNLVWLDNDMDGIQDASEAGIENVKIELVDSNGVVVSTTTTDAKGGYYFNHTNVGTGSELGLKPYASYSVRIAKEHYKGGEGLDVLANKILTANDKVGKGASNKSDSDADSTKDRAEIFFTTSGPGENKHSYDFGLIELATIGDKVWYDEDRDGIQDAGEDGIEGIKVVLYNSLNKVIDVTNTDASGLYLFKKVIPGDYYIKFDVPSEYVITGNDQGGDDTVDSDIGINGKTAVTTLVSGENDLTWDAGLYKLSSIGDTVWYDDDRDGIQDTTEKGVNGVKVTLYKGDCVTKISDMLTDSHGTYIFNNLLSDDYCLGFSDLPSSYKISPQDVAGDDTKDSDVNPTTGKTTTITLPSGVNDLSVDMGIYSDKLSSIGDTVWYDDNRDGVQDPTEKGVNGIKVTLLKDCTTNIATTVTDAKGTYIFRDLAPADYCVSFSDLPATYKISPKDNGGTDETDSDVDPSTAKTVKTTLLEGENDLSWDMGVYSENPASFGDTVWYDDNRNGVQDSTEKGVNGVKVTLLKDCTTKVATTVTDAKGTYIFKDLSAGDYCVEFSNLPSSYKISPKDNGGTDETDSDADPLTGKTVKTTLDEGENDLSVDMGIYSDNLASLGDSVWYDDNRDGIQDPTEKGANGIKVKLLKDCDDSKVIQETVTDGRGVYIFRDVVPADYCVSFSDLPSTYKISPKGAAGSTNLNDSDIDPVTKKSAVTTLLEGENDLSVDMGIYSDNLASIGDTVWYDDDRDGIQDPTEKGANGIKVKLLKDCDNSKVVQETLTDAKGVYIFRDVAPADYCVSFLDLPSSYKISPKGAAGSTNLNDSDIDPVTKKSAVTTLLEGENDLSVDMGIYSDDLSSIGNSVWYDDNKDGKQDEHEKGVNGVKVTLLKDCTTALADTVTDEKGTYTFRGLVPGNYCLEFSELPNGYLVSPKDVGVDGQDSDVDLLSKRTITTTLTEGENDMSWDMGIYSNRYAMIGNSVWYDDNRDGIQNENEKGVESIKVVLYNAANSIVAETTTDRQGAYQFRHLLPDTYSLGFEELPVGYIITKKNVGSSLTDSDVDATTGRTVSTQLSVGEADMSWDMGIYSHKLGTIGDAVWYDDNKNGIQDEYEYGVEAVKVMLYKNDCKTLFRETTTDRDGVYQFRDLSAGNYCVGFDNLPVSYKVSSKNAGDKNKDSNIDPVTKKSDLITLSEGVHDLSIDMGIYHNTFAIIGDTVWYDDNRDGIQDANEKGAEAIRVDLYNKSNTLVASTTTDRKGVYQFRDLVPSKYYLKLSDLPVGYEYSPKNVGTNSAIDSDVDATGKTALTTLSSGEIDLSWDLGIFTRQKASIGNHVWYDDDRDGMQDSTEHGVEAVRVTLYNMNNQSLATTVTDNRGVYQFRDLDAGGYYVGFSDLPVGYEITLQDGTNDDNRDSDANPITGTTVVTLLSEGENDVSWDMGLFNKERASIGDAVWYDDDRDGIQDSDEFGVDAVKVTLYTANGQELKSTITDVNGNYKFGNLEPKDYYLVFSNLPVGYEATLQDMGSDMKDSDVDTKTLRTETTSLVAGENDLSWDMGIVNRQRASIGDSVWYDDNKNGMQDPYEFGVQSVKIVLFSANNTKVAETLTDDRGNYAFRNLSVGTYYLQFSDLPAGYEVSPQDAGDDAKDSDVDQITLRTTNITVTAGQNDLSWDMGIFNKEKASLGNKVWYDRDHDGLQDINETGVSAVKISLYNKEGKVVRTTRTNQYGEYIFRDLVPSEYYVGFTEFPAGYMITKQNVGNDDTLDSDANYHRGETELTTLDAGENDLSWDVGLYIPTLVNFGNYIWDDVNYNGIQDSDEPGLEHVRVTLVKNGVLQIPSEQTTTSTTSVYTDENGQYLFENIEAFSPHQYHIILDEETYIKGSTFSPLNAEDDVAVDSNMNPNTNETVDVVLNDKDDMTHDVGVIIFRTYSDSVTANEDGPITTVSILNNDSANIQASTILLVDENEGVILNDDGRVVAGTSLNTTDELVVEGEGTWNVVDGKVIFTPEKGFTGVPSPIQYVVEGSSGNLSNVSSIVISTPCAKYTEKSVDSLSNYGKFLLLLLTSTFVLLLFRKEFES